jgi:hypothetical protein
MMKKCFLLFTLVILCRCNKLLCPAPDLHTSRQDYTGSNIRLDGIYYSKDRQFFIYRNGVYQDVCSDPLVTAIPDKFKCNLLQDVVQTNKKNRINWKIFIVKGDSIYLEGWELIGDCTYDVFSHTRKIVNDTTLIIPINRDGTKSDTFRFAKFSPKPDSTNSFIK